MIKTVILAGGEGQRLRPYTAILPKPLMPLGNKPILEHIIIQLAQQGFKEIILSVGYLAGLIETYFGDGSQLGVKLSYIRESNPLGTVGPVGMLSSGDDFLVMNGDILTNLDFNSLAEYHRNNGQSLTVSVFTKEIHIDLGVLEVGEKNNIQAYKEKPVLSHDVSMGIYCCSPKILKYIPKGKRFDLPDLVGMMIVSKELIKAYRHNGYWLDIGRHEDYEFALDHLEDYLVSNSK